MQKLACPGCKEFLILLPEPQYPSFLIWCEWFLRGSFNGPKMLNLQNTRSRVYAGHLSTFQCTVLSWCAHLSATMATMALLWSKTMLSSRVYPDICPWSSQQFLKCLMVRDQNYCVVMWTEVPPFGLLGWIHSFVCCSAMLPALDSQPADCIVLWKCLLVQWPKSNTQQCYLQCQLSATNGFQLHTPHKQTFQCYRFTLVNF